MTTVRSARVLGTLFVLALLSVVLPLSAGQPEGAGAPGEACARTPRLHAVLVQNVGPGVIRGLHTLLTSRHGYPAENVRVLGSREHLADLAPEPPTTRNVLTAVGRLGRDLLPGEQVVIVFLCHMRRGCLVNDRIPYQALNDRLAMFRRGVSVAVVVAGCHAGDAIPVLTHADIICAGATGDQKTYGGFLHFLRDTLGAREEAVVAADRDRDGRVSLGEAYDYASDPGRLAKWYGALPEEVWPTDAVPTPRRFTRRARMDYRTWLSPSSRRQEED